MLIKDASRNSVAHFIMEGRSDVKNESRTSRKKTGLKMLVSVWSMDEFRFLHNLLMTVKSLMQLHQVTTHIILLNMQFSLCGSSKNYSGMLKKLHREA